MAKLSPNYGPTNGRTETLSDKAAVLIGGVVILVVGGGILAVIAIYVSAILGLLVVGHLAIGILILAWYLSILPEPDNGRFRFGIFLSAISMLGMAVCATLMGVWQLLPYRETMLAVLGTWAVGSALLVISGVRTWFAALLALFAAVALAAAVVVLPAPQAVEDPKDPSKLTTVVVYCEDEHGNPVGDVEVHFDFKYWFLDDPPLKPLMPETGKLTGRTVGKGELSTRTFGLTTAEIEAAASVIKDAELSLPGTATWLFRSDPKNQVLVIRTSDRHPVARQALDDGYQPARLEISGIKRGEVHVVKITLVEKVSKEHVWLELKPYNLKVPDELLVSPPRNVVDGSEANLFTIRDGAIAPSSPHRGPKRMIYRLNPDQAKAGIRVYHLYSDKTADGRYGPTRVRSIYAVPMFVPGKRVYAELDLAR